MVEQHFLVDGMSCEHCVNAITAEVSGLAGVHAVEVDLAGRTVTVRGDGFDEAGVRDAIDEAGYQVLA
jgi:copper chaperone CopZ